MFALGFTALILGVVSFFYPVGPEFPPGLLFLLAALLGLRFAIRRQKVRRDQLIKAVPRRPLGISDDD